MLQHHAKRCGHDSASNQDDIGVIAHIENQMTFVAVVVDDARSPFALETAWSIFNIRAKFVSGRKVS